MRLTGRLVAKSAAVTGVLASSGWLTGVLWTPANFTPVAGGTMSQHLPLVAAQPGIWMAEKLSDLPSAWSVAHYVELTERLMRHYRPRGGCRTSASRYVADAFYGR